METDRELDFDDEPGLYLATPVFSLDNNLLQPVTSGHIRQQQRHLHQNMTDMYVVPTDMRASLKSTTNAQPHEDNKPAQHGSELLYSGDTLKPQVRRQMSLLVRQFSARASRVKHSLAMSHSPTASSASSASARSAPEPPPLKQAQSESKSPGSSAPKPPEATSSTDDVIGGQLVGVGPARWRRACGKLVRQCFVTAINPQNVMNIVWLGLVSFTFFYNIFTIPLRASFPYFNSDNAIAWLSCDYVCDILGVLHITLYRPRIMFYRDGFLVTDVAKIRRQYFASAIFAIDLASVVPLEILALPWGYHVILRANRLLKYTVYEMTMERLETVLASPQWLRVGRTVSNMLLLVHLLCCAYYAVSSYEGIGTNVWTYDGYGNPYIRCLYFATKTAVSIGKNPRPVTLLEHVFMSFSWLLGVFMFAVFLGQIRDVLGQIHEKDETFRRIMNNTNDYMSQLALPQSLQHRIRLWLNYTWQQQKSLNELSALQVLPHKMQADIALDIHRATLRKVQMFQDCDDGLLNDLVLKLRPINYLPSDYVCRKGEVGREMYIVQAGCVTVVAGPDGATVLATLHQGSVFGEISLLGLEGLDRRTADVKSKGFSTLFVLDKNDLQETIGSYPDAQHSMQQRARALLKKNKEVSRKSRDNEQDVIIKHRHEKSSSPKLLKTLYKLMDENPGTLSRLTVASNLCTRSEQRTSTGSSRAPNTLLHEPSVDSINSNQLLHVPTRAVQTRVPMTVRATVEKLPSNALGKASSWITHDSSSDEVEMFSDKSSPFFGRSSSSNNNAT